MKAISKNNEENIADDSPSEDLASKLKPINFSLLFKKVKNGF